MRVTLGMLMDNYINTLNQNMSSLNDSFNEISSEKKFTRVSQDPAAAMKTMQSYHRISEISQYQDSISEATSWVNNTESTANTVNNIVKSAQETLQQANNSGTSSDQSNQTYAKTLTGLQDELLQTLNSTFNGRYVFGGPVSGKPPFQKGSSGQLQIYDYNGGNYVDFTSIGTSVTESSLALTNPVDVGLGMKIDSSGKVVSGTAFEAQTSSVDMLKVATSGGGITDLYDVMGSAVSKLNTAASSGTKVDVTDELSQATSAQDSVLTTVTDLGEKSQMLGFLGDTSQTNELNQEDRLSELQDVDITKAITNYEAKQMVYQASLSIGTKILQPTLFDFLK